MRVEAAPAFASPNRSPSARLRKSSLPKLKAECWMDGRSNTVIAGVSSSRLLPLGFKLSRPETQRSPLLWRCFRTVEDRLVFILMQVFRGLARPEYLSTRFHCQERAIDSCADPSVSACVHP